MLCRQEIASLFQVQEERAGTQNEVFRVAVKLRVTAI